MASHDVLDNYPSLFVSGLGANISELDLVKVLNEMKVESKVIIERDPITSVPLGRVKIILRYQPDAERFFATVNGSMFLGSKVHLTFKDPNMNYSNTSGAKPIVIKHIPLGVTSLELYDTVRLFGRIISCKVLIDRSGHESYALLQFENQDAADRCLADMNGSNFKGNTIALSWQFPKNSPYQYPTKNAQGAQPGQQRFSPSPTNDPSSRTSPTPGWNATSAGSNQWSSQGQGWSSNPSSPQQPTPPATPQWQQSGGWSSNPSPTPNATYAPGSAPSASNNWSAPPPSSNWHGNTSPPPPHAWESQPPIEGAPNLDEKNLYIKNLEDHIDNLELFNMFRKHGRIVSARVMRDESTGKSKGFGFVSYETGEMATKAIAEMNGRRYGTKTLTVNVAEPKGYREKKLAAIHAGKPGGAIA
ncbi:hypothetical protein BJ742DRAFT_814131 [Cladochytrium replicatum]|nr:hypothetical protein BJ742DRAFT_814131 [Cladochytrium replicatum]